MKKVSKAEFLELFDHDVHQAIIDRAKGYQAEYVVCYECQDFSSHKFGDRSALMVGPNNTRQNLEHAQHPIDMELCSTIKIPTAYVEAAELLA